MSDPREIFDGVVRFREQAMRALQLGLFVAIVVFSTGTFNPKFIDTGADFVQQAIIEVLWIAIVATILPKLRSLSFSVDDGLLTICALVFWAALTAAWAGTGMASPMKAVAMTFNTVGVFLLVAAIGIEAVVETAIVGLVILVGGSLVLVVVRPDIALLDTWMHAGQWAGVFDHKQTLGITAAILVFCSGLRFSAHRSTAMRIHHGLAVVVATICLIGAGSRGGLVLAAAAIGLSLVASWNRQADAVMAWLPVGAMAVSTAFLVTLWVSDLDHLPIGEEGVDFTERTKIWKHVLDNMTPGTTVFGAGINGFWAQKQVEDLFRGAHGWFLDNFHCGFLAVFAETGVIGATLFVVLTGLVVVSALRRRRGGGGGLGPLIYGFIGLFYVINITETYFLRSTNFMSTLFFALLFHLFGRPRIADDAAVASGVVRSGGGAIAGAPSVGR